METTFSPWRSLRIRDRDLLEAIYEISLTPVDLLRHMSADGYTNTQIARELTFRGYRNPHTGGMWTPFAVKTAITKDPSPAKLGPILGPKSKASVAKQSRAKAKQCGSWLQGRVLKVGQ